MRWLRCRGPCSSRCNGRGCKCAHRARDGQLHVLEHLLELLLRKRRHLLRHLLHVHALLAVRLLAGILVLIFIPVLPLLPLLIFLLDLLLHAARRAPRLIVGKPERLRYEHRALLHGPEEHDRALDALVPVLRQHVLVGLAHAVLPGHCRHVQLANGPDERREAAEHLTDFAVVHDQLAAGPVGRQHHYLDRIVLLLHHRLDLSEGLGSRHLRGVGSLARLLGAEARGEESKEHPPAI